MTNIELVTKFCGDNFEQFQNWLEEEHEIESTEAEVILGIVGTSKQDQICIVSVSKQAVYCVEGKTCVMWTKEKRYVDDAYQQYCRGSEVSRDSPFTFKTLTIPTEEYEKRPDIWWTWKEEAHQ